MTTSSDLAVAPLDTLDHPSAPAVTVAPLTSLPDSVLLDLQAKERKLEEIKAALKLDFFGIDYCIDAIIESIKTWFLLPEIIQRPVVACLFGLTGVGKTALVRSLVDKLGFANQFVEIQMDTLSADGESFRSSSICSILQRSSIQEGKPGIVFLDEFQRFRTINERGDDIKTERFQDVWMLLSDGHFSNDYSFMAKIERELAMMEQSEDNDLRWKSEDEARGETERLRKVAEERKEHEKAFTKQAESRKADSVDLGDGSKLADVDSSTDDISSFAASFAGIVPESVSAAESEDQVITVLPKYKKRFSLYLYEAETFKKLLRLSEPVIEIMTWKKEKLRELVNGYAKTHQNNTIDYTKCLIFIGGNLDEAFQMSGNVEDCDTSADVFYEHTRKISAIEIKSALAKRFRPEQIARLGNNHIIYPSLNKAAYMAIIRRACSQYVTDASRICQINFTVNESVYVEIYENSVYPAQGTRPVFSSIHKLFGSPLSDAILWGLKLKLTQIAIGLEPEASSLVFSSGEHRKVVRIDFDIRARKKERSLNLLALVAVHEAGHAIIYAHLFKLAPLEISINVASFKGGYNLLDGNTADSKNDMLSTMCVLMGGLVAEELIFGPELRSSGAANDISKATQEAGMYVRHHGMDGFHSYVMPSQAFLFNHNVDDTNGPIETLVREQRSRASTILNDHRSLLVKLSRELLKVKKMGARQFVEFLEDAIPGVSTKRILDVTGDYAKRLDFADV